MTINHNNLAGAKIFAPTIGNLNSYSTSPLNNTGKDGTPLVLIGVGQFGESVIKKFREFTRFHRSGFSWAADHMSCYSIPFEDDTYEDHDGLTRISANRFSEVCWSIRTFLSTDGLSKCILIADLSATEGFADIEKLLNVFNTAQLDGFQIIPDLLLSVDMGGNLGHQSARVRHISIWQEYGPQIVGENKQGPLVSRAFFFSKEELEDNTLQKAALGLYCLYHSTQPFYKIEGFREAKNLAVNIRAFDFPYKELIDLQAVRISRKVLIGNESLFGPEPEPHGLVSVIAQQAEVISKWNEISENNYKEALSVFTNLLNSKGLECRWLKINLLSDWCVQKGNRRFSSLKSFSGDSNNRFKHINEVLDNKEKEILSLLEEKSGDPFLRWESHPNTEGAASELLNIFFPDEKQKNIQAEIAQRCGFAILDSTPSVDPKAFYIPLSSSGTDGFQQYFYSTENTAMESLIRLCNDCLSDVRQLLELSLTQTPITFNSKFMHFGKTMCDFLLGVEELIAGRTSDVLCLISGNNVYLNSAPQRIKDAYNQVRHIQESGLAAMFLIERDVNFSVFPSTGAYHKSESKDTRLQCALDYEKHWDGTFLQILSPSTVLYLRNRRAVEVLFQALRRDMISFDLNSGWFFSDFRDIGCFYDSNRRARPPYLKTLTSLIFAFRQFWLLPEIDNYLPQLENEIGMNEPKSYVDDWILNNKSEPLKNVEIQDFRFLYKRINNIS